ncbi:glycogenin glucosyltransferase [Polyrhizophydium stewartii]|uniref:Glycogenin glucosyltransferase n=1 Tax=Polyrhizophydium stewartii TaxID=2732419 RepID=A0ABR4N8P9_9FUNG
MAAYAFVTLLTTESYLPGALVLAHSLRRTGTQHALVALYTPETVGADAVAALATAFDRTVAVDTLRTNSMPNLALLGRPDLFATYTKLHVWNPDVVPYERIAFLDADTLVLRNIDSVFGFLDQESVVFAAAPDVGWPDCFNSGVFVTKPSAALFAELIEHAQRPYSSFDGGDQGLLNTFFSSWPGESPIRPRTARLPFSFNVTPTAFYSYLPAFQHFGRDISVVHFIGHSKPWKASRMPDGSVIGWGEATGQFLNLVQQWWAVFDQFQVHVALRQFTLDRNWSLYIPPVAGGSDSRIGRTEHRSEYHHHGHHHGHHSGGSHDFGSYRAQWDERESRGASSRSRSRSPVKGGASSRSKSRSRSPTKKQLPHLPHDHQHQQHQQHQQQWAGSSAHVTTTTQHTTEQYDSSESTKRRSQSPVRQQSHAYGFYDTTSVLSQRSTDSVYTRMQSSEPPTDDFANYRVGWNPRELRGQRKVQSSTRSSHGSHTPDSERDDDGLIFSSREMGSQSSASSSVESIATASREAPSTRSATAVAVAGYEVASRDAQSQVQQSRTAVSGTSSTGGSASSTSATTTTTTRTTTTTSASRGAEAAAGSETSSAATTTTVVPGAAKSASSTTTTTTSVTSGGPKAGTTTTAVASSIGQAAAQSSETSSETRTQTGGGSTVSRTTTTKGGSQSSQTTTQTTTSQASQGSQARRTSVETARQIITKTVGAHPHHEVHGTTVVTTQSVTTVTTTKIVKKHTSGSSSASSASSSPSTSPYLSHAHPPDHATAAAATLTTTTRTISGPAGTHTTTSRAVSPAPGVASSSMPTSRATTTASSTISTAASSSADSSNHDDDDDDDEVITVSKTSSTKVITTPPVVVSTQTFTVSEDGSVHYDKK